MRTIAQISDLHFGRHDTKVTDGLLASLQDSRAHLVVVSGDFTQRARETEFAAARDFLNRVSQPKLVVPGNHDVPLYNPFDRFFRPLAKYDRYIKPLGQPGAFFRDQEIAVLGIDTARRFTHKNGRVSVEQIAEIAHLFDDIPKQVFKALATHHPLAIPEGGPSITLAGRSRPALEAILKTGVHLLLSGHHHQALSGNMAEIAGHGSMLIVHAGTAISTRIRNIDGNTYNLIDIDAGRVFVRVMAWAGEKGFQEKSETTYVFEKDRWHYG